MFIERRKEEENEKKNIWPKVRPNINTKQKYKKNFFFFTNNLFTNLKWLLKVIHRVLDTPGASRTIPELTRSSKYRQISTIPSAKRWVLFDDCFLIRIEHWNVNARVQWISLVKMLQTFWDMCQLYGIGMEWWDLIARRMRLRLCLIVKIFLVLFTYIPNYPKILCIPYVLILKIRRYCVCDIYTRLTTTT